MVRELGRERAVGGVVFGDYQKAGGVLVYAVHYSGALLASDA